MSRELDRRSADDNNDVVTITGGDGGHCRVPCPECPWRCENAGSFPAEAFRLSASTAYDMADRTFACHMTGAERPATCAGALLSTGAEHNMMVRLRLMSGMFRWENVAAGGADLWPDYRSLAEANGVDPADPILSPCR